MTKNTMKANATTREPGHVPEGEAPVAKVAVEKRRFFLVSGITVVLVIAVAAFATLIANRVPWAFDMTAGKVFTLSDQTRQALADLPAPVEIIAIYPRDGVDPMVQSLLDEYGKASPNVDVKYIDAEREPGRLAAENLGVAAVSNGTIIVRSGDKTKFVYQADMFQDTQEGKVFWGERELTGSRALCDGRVAAESLLPRRARRGLHDGRLVKDSGRAGTGRLCRRAAFPREGGRGAGGCSHADRRRRPRSDLSESEYNALDEYLANGGKAMFLVGPMNTNEMVLPNFNKLLNQYGLDIAQQPRRRGRPVLARDQQQAVPDPRLRLSHHHPGAGRGEEIRRAPHRHGPIGEGRGPGKGHARSRCWRLRPKRGCAPT